VIIYRGSRFKLVFTSLLNELIKNQIILYYLTNTVTGKNVKFGGRRSDLYKALNVIAWSGFLGWSKRLKILPFFGHGNRGGT